MNVWSAQCQGLRRRQHRTQHIHTPNPRIGIKVPGPAGNWTRAAGLEGRDSTDHAMATDELKYKIRETSSCVTSPIWWLRVLLLLVKKWLMQVKFVTPRWKKIGVVPVSLICDDLMKGTTWRILYKVIAFKTQIVYINMICILLIQSGFSIPTPYYCIFPCPIEMTGIKLKVSWLKITWHSNLNVSRSWLSHQLFRWQHVGMEIFVSQAEGYVT